VKVEREIIKRSLVQTSAFYVSIHVVSLARGKLTIVMVVHEGNAGDSVSIS